MEHRQDIVLGVLFAGVGVAAAWLSTSYSGASGTYPLVLGLILLVLGSAIVARALRHKTCVPRQLMAAPGKLVLTVGVAAAYIAMIAPLGFYTATVLVMLLLPLVLGFRRPAYLCIMAVVFVAMLFLVFTVVLEKPLPAEIWSSVRMQGE